MDISQLLKKKFIMELTETEKKMSGREHIKLNRSLVWEKLRKQLKAVASPSFLPRSLSFRVCTKPLSRLKIAVIKEQRVNEPSAGFYLLLRTLELPAYHNGVFLLVEDHTGEMAICFLYDHVYIGPKKLLEEDLPVGSVIVLKEPCLKASSEKHFVFVVGSPSDFAKVNKNHILFKVCVTLGWCKKSQETAEKLRARGNDFFKSGKFSKAIQTYLVALDLCTDQDMKFILHLNLAATYLSAEYFEFALKHATCALQINPRNEKALYRVGRAHYELRQYPEARQYFQELVITNPSNRYGLIELSHTNDRMREQEGHVDVYKLYRACLSNPFLPIDFGTYVGPIRVVPIAGKGRGIIATRDLRPGTLLIAEKAIVADLDKCSSFGTGIPELMKKSIHVIMRNPDKYGKLFYDLSCGSYDSLNVPVFCDPESLKEPVVDVYRILEILKTNSIKLSLNNTKPSSASLKCGLFSMASYFNHSCLCNSTCEIYNDVITIRTLTFIKKGEELTISYLSNTETFCIKEDLLNFHGFKCTCILCNLDREDSKEVHVKRDILLARMKELLDSEDIPGESSPRIWRKKRLSSLLLEMENTYINRTRLPIHVAHICLHLAENLEYRDEYHRGTFLNVVDKGLSSVGLSRQILLRCGEDHTAYLPKDALLSEDILLSYCILMVATEFGRDKHKQIQRWMKVLLMLESIFTGGGLRALKDRFKDLPLMTQLLQDLSS